MTGVLIRRSNLDVETDRHRGKDEDGRLQATERGLEHTLSRLLQITHSPAAP